MFNAATEPDYAIAPGEFIREWMDENSVNAATLARRLDVSDKHVSLLLSAKAGLTPDMAVKLEAVTGTPARIWSRYESIYRQDLARLKRYAELADHYAVAEKFPLGELEKRGCLVWDKANPGATVHQLLSLFGVATFSSLLARYRGLEVQYKRTESHTPSEYSLWSWLRLGEIEARECEVEPFSEERVREILPELRRLSMDIDANCFERMVALCASAGVALVFVPEMKNIRVFGATRWIDGTPVIQLSARGKKDDNLWFALFHELGHVVLHPRSEAFIELAGGPHADEEAEAEANKFASNNLVPLEFRERLPRNRNLNAIRTLAAEIGVSPGIVLGQAQHITGDYAWGHQLRRTIAFVEE
ncbi:ImmA/IrrE family metallo-endopeptidase [Dietzia massiliensis]|uniref:ImmA/IrrE family metallo-endopeptidase n=1 Tax=Dietzia massiliensis TaxID=2697499 RepID=UPI001BCE06D2|nr:ImmA/IrrE family metallo-endopeptidase [Dietzia massiliensis]MBS7548308.1 ImmA/IrrE family metallo-endopeptidase [Dietzia massiliensis]